MAIRPVAAAACPTCSSRVARSRSPSADGLASSYFEKVTENWERLNDLEWAASIQPNQPADVRWMTDLVVR